MKLIEQLAIRIRAGARRSLAPLLPRETLGVPASLTVRLDDLDAPGPVGPLAGELEGLQGRIVSLLMVTGALPVRVIGRATNPLLVEAVRFAWRLECPVRLRTDADGLDAGMALALVDAGLRRVELVASRGADAAVSAAVQALREAAGKRDARLEIVVELPVGALRPGGLADAVAALRAAGADGVQVGAPWRAEGGCDVQEALEWRASANRTAPETLGVLARYDGGGPGAPRSTGTCPVAAARLELTPEGTIRACPFHDGAVPLGEDAAPALDALRGHRARIRACMRECVHTELSA